MAATSSCPAGLTCVFVTETDCHGSQVRQTAYRAPEPSGVAGCSRAAEPAGAELPLRRGRFQRQRRPAGAGRFRGAAEAAQQFRQEQVFSSHYHLSPAGAGFQL